MKFRLLLLMPLALALDVSAAPGEESPPVRVLLLSGQNNHNWRETTPKLKSLLEADGRFSVSVTEHPEQCEANMFSRFDVLLSDWNSYGKSAAMTNWPSALRKAFVDFVRDGGGFVAVHGGSSSFPDWTEYHDIAAAAWSKGTSHGQRHTNTVRMLDRTHPVTAGLADFETFDEYWQNPKVASGAKALAAVTPRREFGGSDKPAPVAFATEFGKGRGFTLLLGHDTRAMESPGFGALLRRGTEWAATGTVRFSETNKFWTWVADPEQAKPYFHPLTTGEGTILTALQPEDHPWHRGLWWSWKFINGLNYWEEDPKPRLSQGRTLIVTNHVERKADGSHIIQTELSYHPPGKPPVLEEKRTIRITAPDPKGDYAMDWSSRFTAVGGDILLDRTPVPGEPDGKSWGGYAGLSARLAAGLSDVVFLNSGGQRGATAHGRPARWMAFSSTRGGMVILDHPENLRHPTPWYVAEKMPFFSPAKCRQFHRGTSSRPPQGRSDLACPCAHP